MLALIPRDARILEIGPFFSPMFDKAKHRVSYVDVLTTEQLRARAATIEGGDPGKVPEIDHVWTGGPISELIAERFDVVFSSHNIEHQPCLVSHLADLAALLKPGGAVFLFVPDRRYCFDHFLPPTALTDVLGAWFEPSARHRGEAVVKHWMFLTHNDPGRHWAGDHGVDPYTRLSGHAAGAWMRSVRDTYRAAEDYVDVHAWQFDPEGFRTILQSLHDAGLSELAPVRVYPTPRGGIEFYAILQPD
jgi:SAM-dependent methyltransferase